MDTTSSTDSPRQPEETAPAHEQRKRAWTSPTVIVESAQVPDVCGGKFYKNTVETYAGTRGPS